MKNSIRCPFCHREMKWVIGTLLCPVCDRAIIYIRNGWIKKDVERTKENIK